MLYLRIIRAFSLSVRHPGGGLDRPGPDVADPRRAAQDGSTSGTQQGLHPRLRQQAGDDSVSGRNRQT